MPCLDGQYLTKDSTCKGKFYRLLWIFLGASFLEFKNIIFSWIFIWFPDNNLCLSEWISEILQ